MQNLIKRLGIEPERLEQLSEAGTATLNAVKVDHITDTDLAIFRELFDAENYRRQQLATIPREIAHRREQYIALGGDPADLN